MKHSREELIRLCEMAIVNEKLWNQGESGRVQKLVGSAWALLKAGCKFDDSLMASEGIIWLDIEHRALIVKPTKDGKGNLVEGITKSDFWIPTEELLKEKKGKDWLKL